MKITIVTDAWHPQVNGVVRTLSETAARLVELGYEVTTVTPDQFAGIPISALPGMKLAVPPYRIGRWLDDADMIHIATEGPLGLAARRHCQKMGWAYTTAFHTNFAAYIESNFRIPQRFGYRYLRWFHRDSKAVMVPTKSMIQTLTEQGFTNLALWGRGVDEKVFNRIPHGTGLDQSATRPFWLNVGRVSAEKNIEDFLKLDLPGTKFVVGTGPESTRLQMRYPDVQFLGQKSGGDLAACYRDADVFVFPSRFDTFGLVNIEAISCGTPVAAYPVTGPIDIVDEGINGALDEDLKAACMRALALPDSGQTFSWLNATRQFVDNLVMKL